MRISDWSSDVCSSEAAKPQAKEGKRSEKAAITLDFGATPAMLKAAVPASQTKVADEALAEMLSGGDQSMFDLLPVALPGIALERRAGQPMRSEEHTSELQSLMRSPYAVVCL